MPELKILSIASAACLALLPLAPLTAIASEQMFTPEPLQATEDLEFSQPNFSSLQNLGENEHQEIHLEANYLDSFSLSPEDYQAQFFSETDPILAQGETEALDSDAGNWRQNWFLSFSPYGFLPLSTSGTAQIRNSEVDFHQSLGDVLEALDIAAFGDFTAWYRYKFGIMFTGAYGELTTDSSSAFIDQRDLGRFGLSNLTTSIETQGTSYTSVGRFDLLFAYRILDQSQINPSEISNEFDLPSPSFTLMGGARLWTRHMELNFDLSRTSTLNIARRTFERSVERSRRLEDSSTWIEPVIGASFHGNLSDNLAFVANGTISGFNWENMTLTLIGSAGLDWRFSGNTSLLLRYQGVYMESDRTDSNLNLRSHGPILGMRFRF